MNNSLVPKLHSESPALQSTAVAPADLARLEIKLDHLLGIAAAPESDANVSGGPWIRYWSLFWQRRWWLFVAAIAGLGAACGFTFMQKPVYSAKATLELLERGEKGIQLSHIGSTPTGSLPQDVFIQTQTKLLESESLVKRTVQRLNWTPTARQNSDKWFRDVTEWGAARTAGSKKELISHIRRYLDVTVPRGTSLLQLTYESPDPELSARVVNALATEYIEQDIEARVNSNTTTRDWLSRELDAAKKRLEESERKLQEYARSSSLLFVGAGTSNIAEDKLKRLEEELGRVQAARVAKQADYESLAAGGASSNNAADSEALRRYHEKLTDLKRQLAELSAVLTPKHYKVKQVEAQIAELQTATDSERDKIILRARKEYESAVRNERLVQDLYRRQVGELSDQSSKSIFYNVLRREVDTNRNLYDAMLQSVREAGVNSGLRAPTARIVDGAEPPTRPSSPRPIINALAGLVIGTLVGAAFILGADRMDASVRGPGTSVLHLQVSELGAIPSFSAVRARPAAPTTLSLTKAPAVPAAQTRNVIAEAYRSTLTSILFSSEKGLDKQVLVVTSPGPGDGKTTTVANLGAALAEVGRRVLLIEGDLQRPRLHTAFDVPNTYGLTNLLHEKNVVDDSMLRRAFLPSSVPGVTVLPSGPKAVSTASLLYSHRMADLVRRCRREFDFVIIDTPPVLVFADARVLGRLSDAVILVLRSGTTTRHAATAAKQRFDDDGIPVLGTILNDWNPAHGQMSYREYAKYYDSPDVDSEKS